MDLSFAPDNIDVTKITITPAIDKTKWISIRREIGSFVYRQPPGRNFKFFIWYEKKILGIIELSSPIINLKARDKYLQLAGRGKGKKLRCVMNMTTCMPVQPFGYDWNGGKLIALLGTTLKEEVEEKYKDELKHITVMALNPRPTMYERIFKFLGYTQGKTFSHIPDKQYQEMLQWMRDHNIPIPSAKFGAGSNARQRRILAYIKASKDKSIQYAMIKRPIYIDKTLFMASERNQVIEFWYNRWGLPRHKKLYS